MAENDDGQEKSEDATSRKEEQAREKGQVARSRELTTMVVTMTGMMMLFAMGSDFANMFGHLIKSNFTLSRADIMDTHTMLQHFTIAIQDALLLLMPFFLVLIVATILSSVILGGMSFSTDVFMPKFSKMNPISGLKRMFAVKGLVELFKALLKFTFIGGATIMLLLHHADTLLALSTQSLGSALPIMFDLLGWSAILLTSTLIVVAMIDVPFQLWDHKRQLKMTKQEIRDEMKDIEGKPEVKGRIRQLQREMAQARMMDEVPKADVIVTNPTHYAVALKYDQSNMGAPKVVAKGSDVVAAKIRELGAEHKVAIVEAPPVARAIYFSTEIGDQIPAGLYFSVAKLLAYVFQLDMFHKQGGNMPDKPTDFQIPEELKR